MGTYSKLSTYNREAVDKHYDREGLPLMFLVPHCTSGNIDSTGKNVTDWFCTNGQRNSVNYSVGGKGDISGCIPEEYGAWTTSSSWVDKRGITFEIASANTYPYLMHPEAVEAWMKLSVDICQRYGKTKVLWLGTKAATEAWANSNPPKNEIAIVVHRWYANKSCPGDHFYNNIPGLVAELNRRLGNVEPKKEYNNNAEFQELIAKYVAKIAPKYGIKVYSPVIAQAILESGWGTSNKAKYNNFFGLKYRDNRLTCHNGKFQDGSTEQLPDGTYVPITDYWFSFEDVEHGVEGYFQYTNIDRYKNLKGVTDPHQYLVNIKADGYATSLEYVDKVYNVITKNNLTKYDPKPEPTPEPVKPEPAKKTHYWRVVAGSFTVLKNAQARQTALKNAGYDTFLFEIDLNGKHYWRVVVGSFTVKANATARQQELAKIGYSTFLFEIDL